MPQTKVIIVYSPNQNLRRTVIIPDDDKQVPLHTANIANGEEVMIGSLSDYQTIGPDAMLALHTGQQPSSSRCAVVDQNNNVVCVISADPLIDTHPMGNLYLHNTACAGWTHNNGIFLAPAVNNNAQNNTITFDASILTTTVSRGMYSETAQWPSIGAITFVDNVLNIGCQSHLISDWQIYDNNAIAAMDILALAWWSIYKPTIMQLATTHLANCAAAEAVSP